MNTAGAARATLMRIFVGEADRHGKRPLYAAIVEELRRNGFAGATVLKAIEGFGAHRELHAARSIDFAGNLPVVIEVAEAEEKVRAIVPALAAMIPEGLITLERISMRLIGKTP
jgi:PII-like signaling protein